MSTLGYTKFGYLESGQTSSSNSGSGVSPLTTKGDIYVRNSTTDTRLPVGTDGQILIADSSTSTGLHYVGVTGATGINVISGSSGVSISVNSDVVTLNGTQTLTNKTIDSGWNTLKVTSGSLVQTNLNQVLNQQLLASSTPTFAGIKAQGSNVTFYDSSGIGGASIGFNPSGFAGFKTTIASNQTANRTIALPDQSGTVALTSQLASYVDLTSTQTITGTKTFTSPIIEQGTVNYGSISVPLKYNYVFSAKLSGLGTFIVLNFNIPNTLVNQSVLSTLKATFYDNTNGNCAFIRQTRVFSYNSSTPSMSLIYTSEQLVSKPNGTGYDAQCQVTQSNQLSVFLTPNTSAPSTDVLCEIEFLVRS